jgi:hypothetical protein
VLEAVKARPGNGGVRRYGGATPGRDSFCVRRRRKSAVGAEESLQARSNKRNGPSKKASQQERKRLRSWQRLENGRMLAARVEQKNGMTNDDKNGVILDKESPIQAGCGKSACPVR